MNFDLELAEQLVYLYKKLCSIDDFLIIRECADGHIQFSSRLGGSYRNEHFNQIIHEEPEIFFNKDVSEEQLKEFYALSDKLVESFNIGEPTLFFQLDEDRRNGHISLLRTTLADFLDERKGMLDLSIEDNNVYGKLHSEGGVNFDQYYSTCKEAETEAIKLFNKETENFALDFDDELFFDEEELTDYINELFENTDLLESEDEKDINTVSDLKKIVRCSLYKKICDSYNDNRENESEDELSYTLDKNNDAVFDLGDKHYDLRELKNKCPPDGNSFDLCLKAIDEVYDHQSYVDSLVEEIADAVIANAQSDPDHKYSIQDCLDALCDNDEILEYTQSEVEDAFSVFENYADKMGKNPDQILITDFYNDYYKEALAEQSDNQSVKNKSSLKR